MSFPLKIRVLPDWFGIISLLAALLTFGRYFYNNRLAIGSILRRVAPKNITLVWIYVVNGFMMVWALIDGKPLNWYLVIGINVGTALLTFFDIKYPEKLKLTRRAANSD